MHGFQDIHWVCTNRVCDEAVGTPDQSRREEGLQYPGGCGGPPTIIGLRGSEKKGMGTGKGMGMGIATFGIRIWNKIANHQPITAIEGAECFEGKSGSN